MKNLTCMLTLSLMVAGAARADVIPPDMEPCTGKAAGTTCTFLSHPGTCVSSTCSKLDYANWDRDAASGPPTRSYACILCRTGTATTTTTTTAPPTDTTTATSVIAPTGTDTQTTTTTTTDTSTKTAVVAPTGTVTSTATTSDVPIPQTTTTTIPSTETGTDQNDTSDGGCQFGGLSMRRVVPWMLAGSFSLLFLFARRRRSR